MDFTEGTEFFVDLERAFFETEERILGERFAFFRKNSEQNKDEVFTRLYRYMLRKDLYYLAYQNLYANQGAASVFCVFVPFTICLCFATYEFAYTNSRAKN